MASRVSGVEVEDYKLATGVRVAATSTGQSVSCRLQKFLLGSPLVLMLLPGLLSSRDGQLKVLFGMTFANRAIGFFDKAREFAMEHFDLAKQVGLGFLGIVSFICLWW